MGLLQSPPWRFSEDQTGHNKNEAKQCVCIITAHILSFNILHSHHLIHLHSEHPASEAKVESAPEHKLSSVQPLPKPPPPLKGTHPTIVCTRDVEEYIQPLYSRGWGLCPILPNGNGIPVLRKRFDFVSARALKTFLVALGEYEESKHVRSMVCLIIGDMTNLNNLPAPRKYKRDRGSTRHPRQHVDARRRP